MGYISDKSNKEFWEGKRKSGDMLLSGWVRCKYADIYLLDANGHFYKAWSFQRSETKENVLITDAPYFELNWSDKENPLRLYSTKPFISPLQFSNYNSVHIGRLTTAAMKVIKEKTRARGTLVDAILESNGYVLYIPSQWAWKASKVNNSPMAGKKQKNWLLYAALAYGMLT